MYAHMHTSIKQSTFHPIIQLTQNYVPSGYQLIPTEVQHHRQALSTTNHPTIVWGITQQNFTKLLNINLQNICVYVPCLLFKVLKNVSLVCKLTSTREGTNFLELYLDLLFGGEESNKQLLGKLQFPKSKHT